MKEMIGEFFIAHADAISAAFFFLSVVGILYVARRVSGPTGSPDDITLAQDGHTVTEWPTIRTDVSEAIKDAMLTGTGTYRCDVTKLDWPETGDAGPPYPGGNSKVIYNPGLSVPLQVVEGNTATRIVKRVSIIRCSDPMMWYNDPAKYKGLLFDVLSTNEDGYLIRTPDGTTNYVRYWDATLTYHTERVKP